MPDKPQGQPLAWSEPELDALTTINAAEVQSAAAYWRLLAPKWAKGLLDAKRAETEA
jgi:hypothetical protein